MSEPFSPFSQKVILRILYRPVWEGMLTALRDIFTEGFPADKVIGRHLKTNRRWGSHDRRVFAEGVYDMTRWYRRLAYAAGTDGFKQDSFARVVEAWSLLNGVVIDKNLKSFDFTFENTSARWTDPKLTRAQHESIPDWMDHLGQTQLGAEWDKVLPVLNTAAPIYIRANQLKTNPKELLHVLHEEGLDAELAGDGCIELKQRTAIFTSKAFNSGQFEMQDKHSQKVAPALDLKPGMRVVDACAGAGGKTLHMASLMQNKGKILALDVAEPKLEKLRERATRNGATSIEVRHIDSSKVIKRLRETADRVLLDVPCSGIGVLRRNPDSKWKLSLEEIKKLAQMQTEILENYSKMVKPGGLLVYATCSILPSENSERVKDFLSRNEANWKLDFEQTLLPELNGGDGFFLARLIKS